MSLSYESLIGWRYLLRQRRSPRVLVIGLCMLAVAAGCVFAGSLRQGDATLAQAFYASRDIVTQGLIAGGAAIGVLAAAVIFFGLLNFFFTIFAAFSTFMISIGVAEVILVLGVMNGFQNDLRTKIISTHAHVVIEPAKHGTYLEASEERLQTVRETEGVIGASQILQTEVMLSSKSGLSAVVLQGVDDSITETNQIVDHLAAGKGKLEYLKNPEAFDASLRESAGLQDLDEVFKDTPAKLKEKAAKPDEDDDMAFPMPSEIAHRPTLFVGAELRKSLSVWLGEELNVVSAQGDLGPQGPMPKSRPFLFAGWFTSGMLEYDSSLAYADLAAVQRFVGQSNVISAIEVKVADMDRAREVRDRLQQKLGDTVRVMDWQERNHNLFSALKLEKIAMFMVLTINILLAAFSIIGTLVMTIVERKREVAILTAMGASGDGIRKVFILQGFFTGLCGSICGSAIGLGLGLALSQIGLPLNTEVYYISAIPVDIRVVDFVSIIAVAMFVAVASTIYPARFAARLKPVEGLYCE